VASPFSEGVAEAAIFLTDDSAVGSVRKKIISAVNDYKIY
jgi:hypothetical protein